MVYLITPKGCELHFYFRSLLLRELKQALCRVCEYRQQGTGASMSSPSPIASSALSIASMISVSQLPPLPPLLVTQYFHRT